MVDETADAIYDLIQEIGSKYKKVRSLLINTTSDTQIINEKLATLDKHKIIDIKVVEIVGGQGLLVLYHI